MNAQVTKLKPDETATETKPRTVYQLIAAVMGDVAREGIAKDRNNAQQGYKFRGIDDVYNALSPILSRHGLLILPRVLERHETERQTKSGGAMFNVTVDVEFTLVSAEDGSTHVIRTFGEAQDSADKATNKAMSAAFKYAAMQTFCIPTEGDNDADASTHQIASAEQRAISHLQSCSVDAATFKDAWTTNKDAWRSVMDDGAYRRVVSVMKEIAATFAKEAAREEPKTAPAQPPKSNAFPELGEDDLPDSLR